MNKIIVGIVLLLVIGGGLYYFNTERGVGGGAPSLSLINIAFANSDGSIVNRDVRNINLIQDPKNTKIINAETGAGILDIAQVNAFGRKITETPSFKVHNEPVSDGELHYGAAACFGASSLSNDGERIVFSTGCTPGLKPTFIGVYTIATGEIRMLTRNAFGVDFTWTGDDGSGISFTNIEAGSGLSERITISSTTFLQVLSQPKTQ